MSPDRVLREAARILSASPGMWRVLADALGGELRIPVQLDDALWMGDERPWAPGKGLSLNVEVTVSPGHHVVVQPAGIPMGGLAVENHHGELVTMLWDPETGEADYVIELWPELQVVEGP